MPVPAEDPHILSPAARQHLKGQRVTLYVLRRRGSERRMGDMKTKIADITIEMTRARVKNFNLRVHAPDGRVTFSYPWRVRREEAEAFLRAHAAWLREKVAAVRSQSLREQQALPAHVRTGETLRLWGRLYVLEVVETDTHRRPLRGHGVPPVPDIRPSSGVSDWSSWEFSVKARPEGAALTLSGTRARLFVPRGADEEVRRRALDTALRAELAHAVREFAPQLEAQMDLYAREWHLRNMRTRWGSCNIAAQRIWLSTRLVHYPPLCLRYVICHELAHLVERYHNRHFYAVVARYLPDWQEAERLLKK